MKVIFNGGRVHGMPLTNMPDAFETMWATSHMRVRARYHFTLSTLIGGKGGAGPSLLHTTLGGPTEYVNARWM